MKQLFKISTFLLVTFLVISTRGAFAGCAIPPTPTGGTITGLTCTGFCFNYASAGGSTTALIVQHDDNAGFTSPTQLVLATTSTQTCFTAATYPIGSTVYLRVRAVDCTGPCNCFSPYVTVGPVVVPPCCTSDASLCSDGIQNGCETGVDCGDVCPLSCGASCSDNIQNQNETGIDCGGVCPACGAACATFSSQTMNPAAGSTIDARAADQTITACVNVTYNNSGSNWVHGVYISPTSTGFLSSTATGAVPEANISSMGTTYQWSNQTANFTSSNSGNSITANGWFVETGALNGNPGNNLGWPVAAGSNLGPFCFSTVVSCSGLNGNIAASLNFTVTSDSYSGAWTNTNCGLESTSGASSLSYTLQCPALMPIDLLYFKGTSDGRHNKLTWATASESNNDYFIVYKSTDNGLTWDELKRIPSACSGGNCTTTSYYEQLDDDPANDITYYKIRQYDFDGNTTESNVIGIITPHYFSGLSVIPNPVNDLAGISFKSTVVAETKMRITNISGKLIYEGDYQTEPGVNTFVIGTQDFSNGMYFMELTNRFDTQKTIFIKE